MPLRLPSLLHTVLLLAFTLLLTACGGGGSDSKEDVTTADPGGDVTTPDPDSTAASSITGTAATGAPIDGLIFLHDSIGQPGIAMPYTINADGSFTIDVTDFVPPFMLKAQPNDGSAAQFSYAAGAGVTNITPMTTLALFEAAGRTDVEALFDDWSNRSDSLGEAEVEASAQSLVQQFKPQITAAGVNADDFDLFSSPFSANNAGFDAVLDQLSIVFDPANGSVIVNGVPFTLPDTGAGEPGTPTIPVGDWTLVVTGSVSSNGFSTPVNVTIPNVPAAQDLNVEEAFSESFSGQVPGLGCSSVNSSQTQNSADLQAFTLSANCNVSQQGINIAYAYNLTYTYSR